MIVEKVQTIDYTLSLQLLHFALDLVSGLGESYLPLVDFQETLGEGVKTSFVHTENSILT